MMVTFFVSTQDEPTPWATIGEALDAAEAYRLDLLAAGHQWATPGAFPNAGPHEQYQHMAAGVHIGLMTPSIPDPSGAVRIVYGLNTTQPYVGNYSGEWWFGPVLKAPH